MAVTDVDEHVSKRSRRQVVRWGRVLVDAYFRFDEDDGFLLAGGIAFFVVLSLAPLILVVLGLAGLVLGQQAVQGALMEQLAPVLGPQAARVIEELIKRSSAPGAGSIAALSGALVMGFAATRVFTQLQVALNRVWGFHPPELSGVRAVATHFLRRRVAAFSLVAAAGLLLVVVVVVEGVLAWVAGHMSFLAWAWLWEALHAVLSMTAMALLVGAIYRVLPDGPVPWHEAMVGGIVTTGLLALGGAAVRLYLGMTASYSVYGAAGSLVVFMLATYYSAIIFLYGAELTTMYAHHRRRAREGHPPVLTL